MVSDVQNPGATNRGGKQPGLHAAERRFGVVELIAD